MNMVLITKKNIYFPDFLQHLWCCKPIQPFTMDVTMDIGLGCLRHLTISIISVPFFTAFYLMISKL